MEVGPSIPIQDSKNERAVPEHGSIVEGEDLNHSGYKQELSRNRSLFTLLSQILAIAAIPFGEEAL
jgi:hypothetical protein